MAWPNKRNHVAHPGYRSRRGGSLHRILSATASPAASTCCVEGSPPRCAYDERFDRRPESSSTLRHPIIQFSPCSALSRIRPVPSLESYRASCGDPKADPSRRRCPQVVRGAWLETAWLNRPCEFDSRRRRVIFLHTGFELALACVLLCHESCSAHPWLAFSTCGVGNIVASQ